MYNLNRESTLKGAAEIVRTALSKTKSVFLRLWKTPNTVLTTIPLLPGAVATPVVPVRVQERPAKITFAGLFVRQVGRFPRKQSLFCPAVGPANTARARPCSGLLACTAAQVPVPLLFYVVSCGYNQDILCSR